MVNKVWQVESIATIIANTTNKVNRIEVCTFFKGLNIFGIIAIYLTALKNLQTNRSILIVSKEWTATGFANILHHTTYTYGGD